MSDFYEQWQKSVQAQQQQQQRAQALQLAKVQGIADAKSKDAAMREIMKVRTRSTWAGLKVLAVVCFVILMFLHNTVFAKNTRMFWLLTTVMMGMLIYKWVEIVREDGGLAIGHLSST